MSFRPVRVSTQMLWEKVHVDIGGAAVSTRIGSGRCSINVVPCSPSLGHLSPVRGTESARGGCSQRGPRNPTFQTVDESHSHSLEAELLNITVLSLILKWVANYGLKKLKLEISRYIGPICAHQDRRTPAAATSCSVLPSVEVNVSLSRGFVAPPRLLLCVLLPQRVLGTSPCGCTTVASVLPVNCPPLRGAAGREEETQTPLGRQGNPSGCLRPHSGVRRAHRSEAGKQRWCLTSRPRPLVLTTAV